MSRFGALKSFTCDGAIRQLERRQNVTIDTTLAHTGWSDPDAWRAFHHALWGRFDFPWPDYAHIVVSAQFPNGFRAVGHAHVSDESALWNLIEPHARAGHSTYVSVAVMDARALKTPTSRGGKNDALFVTSLYADFDDARGAGGAHKATNLPTAEEAEGLLAGMANSIGIKTGLWVDTGNGTHAYALLDAPLPTADPRAVALTQAYANLWEDVGRQTGWQIDFGVSRDLARVLRPAGTVNGKNAEILKPVYLRWVDETATMSADFLMGALARHLPENKAANRSAASAITSKAPAKTVATRPAKIGDRFVATVPAAEILKMLGAREETSGALTMPHVDGTISDDTAGNTQTHDGARISIFGEVVAQEWREKLGADSLEGLDSFATVAIFFCGADYKLAARLLARVEDKRTGFDLDALREILQDVDSPAALAKKLGEKPEASLGEVVAAMPESSGDFASLVSQGGSGVVYPNGKPKTWKDVVPAITVENGGARTDLVSVEDGKLQTVPLIPAVVWREAIVQQHDVGIDGEPREAGDPSFRCAILRQDGRIFRRDGFSAEDSISHRKVLARIVSGVGVPAGTWSGVKREWLDSLLGSLGSDSLTREQAYTSMGWLHTGEKQYSYLAPAGSIDRQGPRPDLTVGPPQGSDANAIQPAVREIGWSGLPTTSNDRRDAVCAVAEFRTIATDPELSIVLLGAAFTAPVPQQRHGSVVLAGTSGTGKTVALGLLSRWWTGLDSNQQFSASFSASNTVPGLERLTAFHRDALLTADDYMAGGPSPDEARVQDSLAKLLIHRAYGDTSAVKSNGTGGAGSIRSASFTLAMSGERMPGAESVQGRATRLPMHEGRMRVDPPGASPVDVWRDRFATTGHARAMTAGIIQHLSNRLSELGGYAVLRAEVDRWKADWRAKAMGTRIVDAKLGETRRRSFEVVSSWAAGWRFLRETVEAWDAEMGLAGKDRLSLLLPTEAEVDRVLTDAAERDAEARKESSPALQIPQLLAAMLPAGTGHLVGPGGITPRVGQQALGWELKRIGPEDIWVTSTRSTRLGVVSEDGRHVLIYRQPLNELARRENLFARAQASEIMAPIVAPDTVPGAEPSTKFGFGVRAAGYVLTAEQLSLDPAEIAMPPRPTPPDNPQY